MIHLAILEEDVVWRESLRELFEFVPNFVVDYVSDEYSKASERLADNFDGIVVVGMSPSIDDELVRDTIRRLASSDSRCKVLVLSNGGNIGLVVELLNFGVSGFALKSTPKSQFIAAVDDIHSGGAFLSPSVAAQLMALFRKEYNSDLSDREVEVLGLMAKGKSYTAIASDLFISKTTVKAHMRNIYSKLQVNDKASAIKKAYSQKILISI